MSLVAHEFEGMWKEVFMRYILKIAFSSNNFVFKTSAWPYFLTRDLPDPKQEC
jgi:hypothetical protein